MSRVLASGSRTTSTLAIAAMPSPRPVKPRRSEVVALTLKDRILLLNNLDVEIACRAVARTNLALASQLDASSGVDSCRNLYRQRAPCPNAPVTSTIRARRRHEVTEATTLRARARCHHLAQERTLNGLHFPASLAHRARDSIGSRSRAGTGARATTNCCVDRDISH